MFIHHVRKAGRIWAAVMCCCLASGGHVLSPAVAHAQPRLKVSENGRFLVREGGEPFFYLADTAWELFHRLNREEADRYLENRAEKGFTVIQAVALAELDGLREPNAYGHLPLLNNDPETPQVQEGPANDYWDQVDYVVTKAESLGLVIGMLPTWGDKWNKKWGAGPVIFTPQNAEVYGLWLGQRYRDKPVIWILGGDRPVEDDTQKEIVRAMAHGLREGDGGAHPITFHPTGGQGSAQYFHEEDWLDFNMRQNGHETSFQPRYAETRPDYDRQPPKPVIDGEPIYEDHPISFDARQHGHSLAADVRRPLYWDLFSGAAGHTYGHHSVWQMWDTQRPPVNSPLMPWTQAIDQPGAGQMQFGRRLMESRPFLTRIPDDSIIVPDKVPTAVPAPASCGWWEPATVRAAMPWCMRRGQAVPSPHGCDPRTPGQGLVVRPTQWPSQPDRRVPQPGPAGVRPPIRVSILTGCWSWTMLPNNIRCQASRCRWPQRGAGTRLVNGRQATVKPVYCTTCFVLLFVVLAAAAEDGYPRADLLAEPSDLAQPEAEQQYVILDVRGREPYDQGHVPGARRVDHDIWRKAFADGQDAEGWSRRIGELGIGADTRVVAYDDSDSKDAVRIWWILRYWGVLDARLLNGGWCGWKSAGLPISTNALKPRCPFSSKPRRRSERLVAKQQILDALPGGAPADRRCPVRG